MAHFLTGIGLAVGAVGAAGYAALQYGRWEAKQFVLRQVSVPLLRGDQPIRLLHISDLHLTAHTPEREQWVNSLRSLDPDLVVVTGDFVSSAEGIDRVPHALGDLLAKPGVFVYGSNDFFAAKPINPLGYLKGPSNQGKPRRSKRIPLDYQRLDSLLTERGWVGVNNTTAQLHVNGHRLAFAGTGDAHHQMDRYGQVANTWPGDADLRLGVTHAPYLRVLDAMSDDGADMILAGHTHGGQVCVPGFGALVTNCDIEPARVKGLSRHGNSWLHISAGIGTNPYAAVRVACRPEATMLTLTPA
jgi:uncharacterized protein